MALVLKDGIAVEDNWSIIDTCHEPVPNDFYVYLWPCGNTNLRLMARLTARMGFG